MNRFLVDKTVFLCYYGWLGNVRPPTGVPMNRYISFALGFLLILSVGVNGALSIMLKNVVHERNQTVEGMAWSLALCEEATEVKSAEVDHLVEEKYLLLDQLALDQ